MTMKGCTRCNVFAANEFPKLTAAKYVKGYHYDIIDQSDLDLWDRVVTKHNIHSFPALVLVEDGKYYVRESTVNRKLTSNDVSELYWSGFKGHASLLGAKVEGKQIKQATASASQRRGYPLRSITWIAPNWTHMFDAPHRHYNFDPQWVQSLTYNELQSLHSDAHEGTVNWNYARKR